MPDLRFQAVLKRARASAGLSQWQLAKKSGVKRGAIAQFEIDYRDPNLKTLQKLATALGVVFYVDWDGWHYTRRPVL